MTKAQDIAALARLRRQDRYRNYPSFGDFHGGIYDQRPYVVPWSISAHNVDSPLLVIGQDWNSADRLAGPIDHVQVELGQIPTLPSNRRLRQFLDEHLRLSFEETYATDLFVFAKPGGMTARIPFADLLYCAREYAIRQIEILKPRVAVCLGVTTFNAIRTACGYPLIQLASALVDDMPFTVGQTEVMVVPHTGAWGYAIPNHGAYWERVARRLTA
jgi:restriction system protein